MKKLLPIDCIESLTPDIMRKTLHELRLHQIELETQNIELRRIHAELDCARARYFDLYENAPVGYCTLSEEGQVLEMNHTAAALLEEIKGSPPTLPITLYIYPDDQDIYYFMHKNLLATGTPQSCELRMRGKAETPLWVRLQAVKVQEIEGSTVHRLVISDITQRKHSEKQKELALAALKQSEARYLAIIEKQTELVCRYLPDGRLSFVNEAYVNYFGQHRQDILDRNYIPNIPVADIATIQERLHRISPSTPLIDFEHRVIMPNGSIRWQYWIHCGIYSAAGELLETQAVGRDITDRFQAERERDRLMEELSRKNAELERFTYTASHDLRSPLITIQGFASEMVICLAENDMENLKLFVQIILNSARHMDAMLQGLIKLARLGKAASEFTLVNLDTLLQEVRESLAGSLLQYEVTLILKDPLPSIKGCPTRLHELFQNLIENSIKFRTHNATPVITIGIIDNDTCYRIFVQDNGIGIAPEQQQTIFDLFCKLDVNSEGSGIGLSLVHRIVAMHNGKISVESSGAELGTTFWLELPKTG